MWRTIKFKRPFDNTIYYLRVYYYKQIMTDIKNYEGHYQINEDGEIFSLKYKKVKLKPSISRANYPQVVLSKNGKAKCEFIHILLAETFLEHMRNNGFIVDHIDNNPMNCKLNNLQLITHGENKSKTNNKRISKYRGVAFCKTMKKKFKAQIIINKVLKTIGYFNTEEEASIAYEKELLIYKNSLI